MKKNPNTGSTGIPEGSRPAAPVQKTEQKSRAPQLRSALLIIAFALVCLAYVLSLFRIINDYTDTDSTEDENYTVKTVAIQAVRGEIYDCNGKVLVSNSYKYSLSLEYGLMSEGYTAQNEDIAEVMSLIDRAGLRDELELDYCVLSGAYPEFEYNYEVLSSSVAAAKFSRILKASELDENATAAELGKALAEKYSLLDKNGNALMDAQQMSDVICVRYEMEAIQFAPSEPLVLISDIGMDLITGIEELNIGGTYVSVSYSRVYNYPGYASHILGRISKIHADDLEKYTSAGYPINALVGVEGCELAFEEYLRGTDGEMEITVDSQGRTVSETVTKEPVPGKDVYLTIDIDLQIAAETAIENNINYVHSLAAVTTGDLDGEDCDAGAIVVQQIGTGALLAVASYPSYDLTTYTLNYNSLLADPAKPLVNRALDGTYAPGSTFKVAIAAGALMDETVMADGTKFNAMTVINTQGKYTYYEDYQPICWLYNYGKQSHGRINVTKALEVSCNCFFYEVGRCMGIETINRYAAAFGLGQTTGIELHEAKGVLADRAYSESLGTAWTGGLTIQTAIGQGYNLFTPLQLSTYLATVVDGGVRYKTHLLSCVKEFGGDTTYTYEPEVVSSTGMSDSIRNTLINAMSRVVDENTSVTAFDSFDVKVGGKTGSIQVNGQSRNGIFMGFAPLDDPEIAVVCVLERGSAGANAAYGVRWVMDEYFKEDTQTADTGGN